MKVIKYKGKERGFCGFVCVCEGDDLWDIWGIYSHPRPNAAPFNLSRRRVGYVVYQRVCRISSYMSYLAFHPWYAWPHTSEITLMSVYVVYPIVYVVYDRICRI